METPRIAEGERRVSADQWDIDGWHILASEADKISFSLAKPIYERLVEHFPPIGKFWKSYAERVARESPTDHEAVIAIYDRGVEAAPTSIDLWRAYLDYSLSLVEKAPGVHMESETLATYERAIAAAGLDLNAHPLWTHYIEYLKNHSSLPDSQQRDAMRRLYQRAVRCPMQNLDTFWRDYNTFEQTNNASKELARSHIAEYQPKNIEARAEFRARRTRREGLTLTTLPVPPRGRAKESSQAQQWRRFIAFDRSNPSALPQSELNGRIVHAFESALAPLYRYPDIWIEYLSYIHETHAAALQLMSSKGNDKESCSAANSESSPAKRIAASLESLLTRAIKALPSNVAVHNHVSWLYPRIGKASKAVGVLDGLCRNHPSPLAYVHLMKATRKHDGRDAARKAFGRARKDPNGAHPCVYVAAALMEFSVNKDSKVARNVFEFGLKNFAKNAVMAAEYVNWLWGTGDLEYARVVMKKVMPDADGSPADIRRLWEKWLELEEVIGDAASVDQVEEMWKDSGVGRSNGVVEDVLRRSRFLGFEGLSEDERAAMDGLRTCNNENIGGSSGNGTGRRDPRTGRRVASSSNKESGGGSTGPRRGDGSSQHTPLTVATEWLKLMAASMPPIAAPAPATDVLFRLIRETPGSYSDTPAGANSNGGGRNGKKDVTGKKRKAEDLGSQNVSVSNMNTGGVVTPPTDVFRARQAAKQSRMR